MLASTAHLLTAITTTHVLLFIHVIVLAKAVGNRSGLNITFNHIRAAKGANNRESNVMRIGANDDKVVANKDDRVAELGDAELAKIEGGEFTLSPVPPSATTAAYKIGIMLLAANISLPAFVMGGELGASLGVKATAIACLWGGVILALVAGCCAYAGTRSRLTTYVLIMNAFGRRGGELVNLLLSFSAIGWFGVVVMLFAETMVRIVSSSTLFGEISLWAGAGTLLMIVTTIFGFKALNFLSMIMLPLKLLLLIWALVVALQQFGTTLGGAPTGLSLLDSKSAISFVVGGWIVGAVVAPDYARFARSQLGGAFASAFALGAGYPLVLIATAIPAVLTGEKDMIVTMTNLGMGLSALTIVLLAAWTNGASNIYSGSLMLATVFRHHRRSVVTIVIGLLGMVLGLLGITDRIVPYLLLLSIAVPPIAGVYLPRFFIDLWTGVAPLTARNWQPAAIISWGLGMAVAGLGDRIGFIISGITAIDSLMVSAISYLAFEFIRSYRTSREATEPLS